MTARLRSLVDAALLSIGADIGTRVRWPRAGDGEAERWIGTAPPQAGSVIPEPVSDRMLPSQLGAVRQTSAVSAAGFESAKQYGGHAGAWPRRDAMNGTGGALLAREPDRSTRTSVRPDESTSNAPWGESTPFGFAAGPTVLWQRGFLNSAMAALKRVARDRGGNEATWMDAAQRLKDGSD